MKVNVSDINKHDFCPRAIYLTSVLGLKSTPTQAQVFGILGHAIRKELSLRQAKIVKKAGDAKDFTESLNTELENIIKDAPFIYKDKISEYFEMHLPLVKNEMRKELELLNENLKALVDDLGFKKALNYLTPKHVEYQVKSDKLNLSGRIDKIYERETIIPVEIKTGTPAEYVWEGDKRQVIAYAMMLEEQKEIDIPHALVEYTKIFEERPVLNTEKIRREILKIRDEIQEILDDNDPGICPHGNPRKCESCGLAEECYKT